MGLVVISAVVDVSSVSVVTVSRLPIVVKMSSLGVVGGRLEENSSVD